MIVRWNWWHCNWWNAMWTMYHAACYTLLMCVVSSFLWCTRILGLVLEIQEATMSICMGLCLHHFECFLILVTFSVNWTSPDHQLLVLMTSLTLHVLLVLHILKVIILLLLMCNLLHVLVKLHLFWINSWVSFLLILLNFVGFIDQVRFNSEIFLWHDHLFWRWLIW